MVTLDLTQFPEQLPNIPELEKARKPWVFTNICGLYSTDLLIELLLYHYALGMYVNPNSNYVLAERSARRHMHRLYFSQSYFTFGQVNKAVYLTFRIPVLEKVDIALTGLI